MCKVNLNNRYASREAAGRVLSRLLAHYQDYPNVLAIAVGKCSVPVAVALCKNLGVELDVIAAECVTIPNTFGEVKVAITSEGDHDINMDLLLFPTSFQRLITRLCAIEKQRLREELRRYRFSRGPSERKGHHVVLIEDGALVEPLIVAAKAVAAASPASITIVRPYATVKQIDECRLVADHVITAQVLGEPTTTHHMYHDNHDPSIAEIRYLLWDTWYGKGFYSSVADQSRRQLSNRSQPASEVINKDLWDGFLELFGRNHKGWSVTLKKVSFRSLTNRGGDTFHMENVVPQSRFVDLRTMAPQGIQLGFILDHRRQHYTIPMPRGIFFHNTATDNKILRISSAQDAFYIQVSLPRRVNLNH